MLPIRFVERSFTLLPRSKLAAVAGLTIAALSHVSLLSGLGNSWSQPLFEKRPSCIVGSGLNTISNWELGDGGRGLEAWLAQSDFKVSVLGCDAVLETKPS